MTGALAKIAQTFDLRRSMEGASLVLATMALVLGVLEATLALIQAYGAAWGPLLAAFVWYGATKMMGSVWRTWRSGPEDAGEVA